MYTSYDLKLDYDDGWVAVVNTGTKIAQEYRYDNMMSARSYAGYDNAFQEEAIKLAKWASSCWVVAGQIENEVANGANMPTIEDVISRLPIYE